MLLRRSLCFVLLGFLGLGSYGCKTTSPGPTQEEIESIQARRNKARQEAEEFERIQMAETKIWSVMAPLMKEAANYNNKETFGYIGAAFATERFYDDKFRTEARQAGMGPFVSAVAVFPGSPAERAGMQVGDRIYSINGKRLPRWDLAARYASVKLKRSLKPGEVNKIVVQRGSDKVLLEVVAEKAAYYATIVEPTPKMDLRTDGEIIWVSRHLAETLEGSDNLAYICAFGLARNVMRHPEKRRKNALIGGIFDAAALSSGIYTIGVLGGAGSQSFSADFSIEADLIALYLLAATGHEIDKYPDFWKGIMTSQMSYGRLGKREMERLETMRQVIDSIKAKKASGRFIFPEEYLSGDLFEIQLNRFASLMGTVENTYLN